MSVSPSLVPAAGWQARLSLNLQKMQQRTVLRHQHMGPLRVQRPFYPEGEVCHVYLVHPPAGVVGGDQLHVSVQAEPHSAALITTPGATQFYRSAGETAKVVQRLQISDARLDWLPQENIYFDGAVVDIDTTIKLYGSASFIGWDLHCFGRPAADEQFENGHVCISQRIERDGVPLLRERLLVESPLRIYNATGLRGFPVSATLIATSVEKHLVQEARAWLANFKSKEEPGVAVTLIDDLFIARYMGRSSQRARQIFTGLWQMLRPEVHRIPACLPRIWAT